MKSSHLIGRKLANFRIQRLIGRGGTADVYYGMDEQLHRPVAIKVFELRPSANPSQANRFLQEARTMAQWRHNNIVQIHYAGDATGLFYHVMEYVEGYDLASILALYEEKGELMPFTDVLRIGDSIANALDFAHEHQIIHRDVKPANVFIAKKDGRVVLGDFGLALNLNDRSQGEVFGSPHYISPEQARRSSDAVAQSDLYSLGVILFEMLTNATPFNDPTPATLALQHITEPPPSPRTINPALSVDVERVILKALDKKPANRYQTGKDLMTALSRAISATPVTTPPNVPALPPIPVGAPTVQRSTISLDAFTRRHDVADALKKRSAISHSGEDSRRNQSKNKLGLVAFFGLVLIATFWFFRSAWQGLLAPTQAPTTTNTNITTSLPTGTEVEPSPVSTESIATNTPLPPTAMNTPTSVATFTLTITPFTETPSVLATSTIKYPTGHLMILYYDENSFYMINLGKATRSSSGFRFERINDDGTFSNRYDGWRWDKKNLKVLRPKYCLSLEQYPVPSRSATPMDCIDRVLSNIQLSPASDMFFWRATESAQQFRVLWLNDEIARCDIAAGVCEIYVP